MTWNIRNGMADDGPDAWEYRKHWVAEIIRGTNPEVLGVQEAFHFQMDFLAAELTEFASHGVGRDDGVREGEYCGFFIRKASGVVNATSTLWFSDEPDRPGSRTWGNQIPRCVSVVEAEISGRRVWLYNLHLDHESQESRIKSVAMLQGILKRPCIVLGDFNAVPGSPEIRSMALSNAATDFPCRDFGTFHGFTGMADSGPIDYIFLSEDFAANSCDVDRRGRGGRYPSDHFPVLADVMFRERGLPPS